VQQDTITTSEFRKAFGEVLDTVLDGKQVVITNHKKPWVTLAPPGDSTDEQISAFELRLNIKVQLGKIHHSRKTCAVIRKGLVVAVIATCST
jgi:prevent-host-death family protein